MSAAYYYTLTDGLDSVTSGDENDAIATAGIGVNFYFKPNTKGDIDRDGIPDRVDLAPNVPEDKDGYLDHDGKPDVNPPMSQFSNTISSNDKENNTNSPIVIHYPIKEAEENYPITIIADIYEEKELRIAAILYRNVGINDWNILTLENKEGTRYEAKIPGNYITPAGLEYCVLAVASDASGVGRSGWTKQPIQVHVNKNASTWRILGGTVATLGWGLATYFMLRKQSIE